MRSAGHDRSTGIAAAGVFRVFQRARGVIRCRAVVPAHSRASVGNAATFSSLDSSSSARSHLSCESVVISPFDFGKNLAVKRQNKGKSFGAGQRDVKQPLHLLSLDDLQIALRTQPKSVLSKNDLWAIALGRLNQARVSRNRRAPYFSGQKRYDHRLPLRAFGFVRGDQLDRICRGRIWTRQIVL